MPFTLLFVAAFHLSYLQALLHQTVGYGFQILVVTVSLSAHPFDGFFITPDVEHIVQPKNFFRAASSPRADGSELQGIVSILTSGLPKLDVAPDGKTANDTHANQKRKHFA